MFRVCTRFVNFNFQFYRFIFVCRPVIEANDDIKTPSKSKSKSARILTSQEESILLPLLQGLIAAGGGGTPNNESESNTRRKNSIDHEKSVSRRSSGSKASQSDISAMNELNEHGRW